MIYIKKNKVSPSTDTANAKVNDYDYANNYIDSTIKISKRIVGLEDIEITSMNISSSSNSSLIEISFKNSSISEVNSCKINLYLLGEDESVIFGTLLDLPNMEPDSFKTFNVLCGDNISNISDYKVIVSK